MAEEPTPSLGEIAYNAYCEQRKWISVREERLPSWEDQDEELQEAWEVAAEAVIVAHQESLRK
jgi:hypothetical protein